MDIVIPYVDGDDSAWQDVFFRARGQTPRNDAVKQALYLPYKCRFSSHNLFKYWWRALDANYVNIDKIHLLLLQESQFPTFLNPDDPRIVVHYHRDFIPEEHTPCFNSSTIELCAIKNIELSKNFILANDDMYVNAPVDDRSFQDKQGRPLTVIMSRDPYGTLNAFRASLTNGHALVARHYNKPITYYRWHHLFQVYNTEFCKDFLSSEWETITSGNGLSQWRHNGNYNHLMLMIAQNTADVSVHSEKFPYLGYFETATLTKDKFALADVRQVVCFNDTTGHGSRMLEGYLGQKYPDKCSFEI